MTKVLVTGMSGTGKSAVLAVLSERGHRVVDTDTDRWSSWVTQPDGSPDWIWREDAITALLASHQHGHLFVAGCKTNQGKFQPQFDHVALLSARLTSFWPGSPPGPATRTGSSRANGPRSCGTWPR
jgi:hypothetical protein